MALPSGLFRADLRTTPEERRAIEELIHQYGLYIVALLVFVGELGIPTGVPVEVALLLGGAYAVNSETGLIFSVLFVVGADLAGTITLHLVARTGGSRLLSRIMGRFERRSEETMARWHRRLGGRDRTAVFLGRMVPIARMYVAIGAGLLQIRFRDYVIGTLPAAFFWAGLPLSIGYLFKSHVHTLTTSYARIEHIALATVPVLILLAGVVWWVRRGRSLRGQVLRGRAALGALAVVGTTAYLVNLAWSNMRAARDGSLAIPTSLLVTWLVLLAVLTVALLAVTVIDLRAAYRLWEQRLPFSRLVAAEAGTTILWLALLAGATGIMLGLKLRYPYL